MYSFLFLFTHALPLHQYAIYYDQTIVQSNSCYLTNQTLIEGVMQTKIGSYFTVTQYIGTWDQHNKYPILQPDVCGEFLIPSTNNSLPRSTVVSILRQKYPNNTCIQLIDAMNINFTCWFNKDLTSLIDPRTSPSASRDIKLSIAGSSIIGSIFFLCSLPFILITGCLVRKNNKKNWDDVGVGKGPGPTTFACFFLSNVSVQLCFAIVCFMFPWLGWILWPIGRYIGFMIFAAFIIVCAVLFVLMIVAIVMFKIMLKYHTSYFRVFLIVLIALSIAGILYQIGLVYPMGVWGLEKLSRTQLVY
jgi:hypothetical protein